MRMNAIRSVAYTATAVILGIMWLIAAAAKLRSPLDYHEVQRYFRRPEWLVRTGLRVLPWFELLLGLLLISNRGQRAAAAVSAVLLGSFTVLLSTDYFRRALASAPPRPDCGCFGRRRVPGKTEWTASLRAADTLEMGTVARSASDIARTVALTMLALILVLRK
jgi:uncharacterized membrane protein YphA (DoxX/SURF4 family)